MGFERLSDVLGQKDMDSPDDVLKFFDQVRKAVRQQTGVEVESIRYKNEIVTVMVATSAEASEVRLRHIQVERLVRKVSGRAVRRVAVRMV